MNEVFPKHAAHVVVLLCLLVMTVSGCGGSNSSSDSGEQTEISRNQKIWTDQGIRSYQYVLTVQRFTLDTGPVRITVVDGQTTSIQNVNGTSIVTPGAYTKFNTIDKLFVFLQEARATKPAQQNQTFDPDRGIPTQAYVDYVAGLADEELGFTVSNFTPTTTN